MVNFYHPMQIVKANPTERGDRIEVLLRASSEQEDSQGETILKSAYADTGMRTNFQQKGYYDYNHLTDILEGQMREASGKELNDLLLKKEKAIIGFPDRSELAIGLGHEFPTSFKTQADGVYSYGYLVPSNDFVKEMIPKMKAGFAYGASVSGTCTKSDMVGSKITRLNLRKIAIAPLNDVINQDTVVFLKSKMVMLRNVIKSFTDMPLSEYSKSMHSEITEEDRLEKIERKLSLLEKIIMANPETQDAYLDEVLSDIRSKIDSEQIQLGYSPVKDALMSLWCMNDHDADYTANQFLLNYKD